jgi:mono/diheme cytochrome c family protein
MVNRESCPSPPHTRMPEQRSSSWDSALARCIRSSLPWLAALIVGLWAAPAWAQGSQDAGQQQAAADTPAVSDQVIEAGRAIFHGSGTCHACHGDDLDGGAIAPSLRGPKWRHIDGSYAAMLDRIRHGKDGTLMVGDPGGITDAEAVQVATYVWAVSQGKTKP